MPENLRTIQPTIQLAPTEHSQRHKYHSLLEIRRSCACQGRHFLLINTGLPNTPRVRGPANVCRLSHAPIVPDTSSSGPIGSLAIFGISYKLPPRRDRSMDFASRPVASWIFRRPIGAVFKGSPSGVVPWSSGGHSKASDICEPGKIAEAAAMLPATKKTSTGYTANKMGVAKRTYAIDAGSLGIDIMYL
ncbi:hypothetical protein K440DRAFT_644323 [Wilcoxina mikolae CBS 423.85]|nr:hypothetical protein K440DRAFT_644323 [Wilcoxina mikolae CBS 423.85]